jgi:hypothetical protein
MKSQSLRSIRTPGLTVALAALLIACSGSGGTGAEQIAAAKALLEKNDGKAAVIVTTASHTEVAVVDLNTLPHFLAQLESARTFTERVVFND